MFRVSGLAESIEAVVDVMAVFLFETVEPRKACRLPRNSSFPATDTPIAEHVACFMPFNFLAQKLPIRITGWKEARREIRHLHL
jgi:hypothetical protein